MTAPLTRERRAELLSVADREALIDLAELCVSSGPDPQVTVPVEVGTVAMVVREPVVHDRLILADVLVTRAEVSWEAGAGWAMRLGDDRPAALAAAVCDAEVEAGRARSAEVETLCRAAAAAEQATMDAQWAELAPTVVNFEEM